MRALLKIAYRLTTLIASLAGHGFKATGFSYYLREELDRRRLVLVGLYKKQLTGRSASRRDQHDPILEGYLQEFNALDGVMKGEPLTKRIAFAGLRKMLGQNTCTHPHINSNVLYYFDGCTGQGFSDCPDCGQKIYQGDIDSVRNNGPNHLPLDPRQPLPLKQAIKREASK